jgi:hypothetical protein
MEGRTETVDLSIIIVNWNTRDHLRACLQSIYAHPPSKYTFEVIVVDNASADGSVDMVRREFPQVHVIANDYNYGFAKATNQGYRISRGRYVMTLNPDTEVFDGTLDAMIEFLDTYPHVGLVAPAVVNAFDEVGCLADPLPKLEIPFVLRKLGFLHRNALIIGTSPDIDVGYVSGTGLVCRRTALGQTIMLDEKTFLFGEEHRLCMAIRANGYIISMNPMARIRHQGNRSRWVSCEVACICGSLLVAAWYDLRREKYGVWNAKLNSLILLVDTLLVYAVLRIKSVLAGSSQSRKLALAEWQGRLVGLFHVLARGDSYVKKINRYAEDFLNHFRSNSS